MADVSVNQSVNPAWEAESSKNKWWTLAAVGIGLFMLLLDLTIVIVALPSIQRQLHGSISDLQWVIDAYALSLGALMLTAGSLADLLGRKRLWVTGIVIFTAGSIVCGAAQSSLWLTLARAGQGVGGAIMFATSLALIANAFRGKDRGTAFAIFGAITGIAAAVGPVIGGAITSGLSWRWIFFVNIPIGVILVALTLLRVDESRDPDASLPDWIGFVTWTPALGLLVYGLIESSTYAWGSTRVAGSLIASGVLLVLFIVAELRQRHPMFDMSLLRKPTFVGGLTSAFAISASALAMLTFLVLYLQNILHLSAIQTGLRLLVLSGATLLTAGMAGRLTAKVPTRLLLGPGFVLRSRAPARARHLAHLGLDAPAPGLDRHRARQRPGADAACKSRGRCRRAAPCRHGFRNQQHVPSGRHRCRCRGTRIGLRESDP